MLWPCERAPPGLGLSCPQPDPDHPARWVRFFLSSPVLGVRLMTALQVLQKGVGHRAQLMLRAEGELRENNHPLCRCCVHQHNNTTKSSLSRLSCPHSGGSARGCWSTSNSSSESDTRQRLHPPPPIRRLRPPRPTIRRLRPPPPRGRSEIPQRVGPPSVGAAREEARPAGTLGSITGGSLKLRRKQGLAL